MSFKSYATLPLKDGSLELSDPHPLKFSGPDGLIARFVAAQPSRAAAPWKIQHDELNSLSGLSGERALVFEEAGEGSLELQWLQDIHGISDTRTEMLFSMLPLKVESATRPLRVRYPTINRVYAEELILDGGVGALEGTWRWCKPHLSLGGVVLQKRALPDVT